MSKPKLTTERFNIFKVTCDRGHGADEYRRPRDVYLAFPTFDDIPRPVVAVTVWPNARNIGNYLEWVEVDPEYRRKGFAHEVVGAIENLIGPVTMDGVTDAGRAFVASYQKARQQFGGKPDGKQAAKAS